ncbi:hypothetical protein D3C86_490530 [compost metagenome]
MVLGSIIAVAIALSQPKVWPAMALAKIAQVGGSGPIADPAAVLARAQFPSFVIDALRAANMPTDINTDAQAKLAKKTLSVQVQRGPSLFQLQVDGYSTDDAEKFLNGALAVLQKEHQAQLDLAIEEKTRKLKNLDEALEMNEKERQSILSSIESNAAKSGQQLPDTVVVSYLLRANEMEAAKFREQQAVLKDQLQETKTFNTQLVAPIYVAGNAQSPSKVVAAGIGALFGLVIMMAFFVVFAWLRPTRP